MPLAIFFLVLNVGCAAGAYSNGNSLAALALVGAVIMCVLWIAFLLEEDGI